MGKVLAFDNSYDRYVKLAEQKAEQGDVISALVFAFNAFSIDSKKTKAIELIAFLYSEARLFELSNDYWFMFLDRAPESKRSVAYGELSKNHFCLNDYDVGAYYLHKKLVLDGEACQDVDATFNDFFETLENERFKRKYKVVKSERLNDYSFVFQKGVKYLSEDNFEKAIEAFKEIPETADCYLEARENLANVYMLTGDLENLSACLKESVKNGAESVSIYKAYFILWSKKGNTEKCKYYYEKALGVPPRDLKEIRELALLAVNMQDHENVKKYASRVVKERPFDLRLVYLLALAYLNTKEYQIALLYFNFIIKIDPRDTSCKYYARLAKRLMAGEVSASYLPLDYPDNIGGEELKRRIKFILSLEKGSFKEINASLKNPETLEILEWAVFEAEEKYARKCIFILAFSNLPITKAILKNALLSSFIENELKSLIIFLMLSFGHKGKISFTIEGVFTTFKPKNMQFENDEKEIFKVAYALCVSKAIFYGDENIENISLAIKDVYDVFKNYSEENLEREEIASLAFYFSGCLKIENLKEPYALFNVKKERFNYLKKLCKGIKIRSQY